jgi:glycosyltransferase involved in cell wall biosynthesis
MLYNKKIVVVMPAYNAEKTLEATYNEIPLDIVDEVIVVDDASKDNTVLVANSLGIKHVIRHEKNKGYGGNQKTCYDRALSLDADIVIMIHPDYQYTPLLIPAMCQIIASGLYPVVIGSRILGKGALKGGMPYWRYIFNRALTFFQNIVIGEKLSEYHTGYRSFSKEVLRKINYHANSNDFIFDNQMLSQILYAGFEIAEITCPTKYFAEASSISLMRSIVYSLGVINVSFCHFLQKMKLARFPLYQPPGEKHEDS